MFKVLLPGNTSRGHLMTLPHHVWEFRKILPYNIVLNNNRKKCQSIYPYYEKHLLNSIQILHLKEIKILFLTAISIYAFNISTLRVQIYLENNDPMFNLNIILLIANTVYKQTEMFNGLGLISLTVGPFAFT